MRAEVPLFGGQPAFDTGVLFNAQGSLCILEMQHFKWLSLDNQVLNIIRSPFYTVVSFDIVLCNSTNQQTSHPQCRAQLAQLSDLPRCFCTKALDFPFGSFGFSLVIFLRSLLCDTCMKARLPAGKSTSPKKKPFHFKLGGGGGDESQQLFGLALIVICLNPYCKCHLY